MPSTCLLASCLHCHCAMFEVNLSVRLLSGKLRRFSAKPDTPILAIKEQLEIKQNLPEFHKISLYVGETELKITSGIGTRMQLFLSGHWRWRRLWRQRGSKAAWFLLTLVVVRMWQRMSLPKFLLVCVKPARMRDMLIVCQRQRDWNRSYSPSPTAAPMVSCRSSTWICGNHQHHQALLRHALLQFRWRLPLNGARDLTTCASKAQSILCLTTNLLVHLVSKTKTGIETHASMSPGAQKFRYP